MNFGKNNSSLFFFQGDVSSSPAAAAASAAAASVLEAMTGDDRYGQNHHKGRKGGPGPLQFPEQREHVRFQQTHNQGLRQLFMTLSWDLRPYSVAHPTEPMYL